jgi:hypothetical protein
MGRIKFGLSFVDDRAVESGRIVRRQAGPGYALGPRSPRPLNSSRGFSSEREPLPWVDERTGAGSLGSGSAEGSIVIEPRAAPCEGGAQGEPQVGYGIEGQTTVCAGCPLSALDPSTTWQPSLAESAELAVYA